MGSLLEQLKGGRTSKPKGRSSSSSKRVGKSSSKGYVKAVAAKGKGPKRP